MTIFALHQDFSLINIFRNLRSRYNFNTILVIWVDLTNHVYGLHENMFRYYKLNCLLEFEDDNIL